MSTTKETPHSIYPEPQDPHTAAVIMELERWRTRYDYGEISRDELIAGYRCIVAVLEYLKENEVPPPDYNPADLIV